jgi:hypothetical protein
MRGAQHSLTIRQRTPTTDTEGRVSYANSDSSVRGHVSSGTVDALDPGDRGQYGQLMTAVALVPTGTTVTDNDQIVVAGIDAILNGIYNIDSIQYTRLHLRLALRGVPS